MREEERGRVNIHTAAYVDRQQLIQKCNKCMTPIPIHTICIQQRTEEIATDIYVCPCLGI